MTGTDTPGPTDTPAEFAAAVAALRNGSLWSTPVKIGTWYPADDDARESLWWAEPFTLTEDQP